MLRREWFWFSEAGEGMFDRLVQWDVRRFLVFCEPLRTLTELLSWVCWLHWTLSRRIHFPKAKCTFESIWERLLPPPSHSPPHFALLRRFTCSCRWSTSETMWRHKCLCQHLGVPCSSAKALALWMRGLASRLLGDLILSFRAFPRTNLKESLWTPLNYRTFRFQWGISSSSTRWLKWPRAVALSI